jgi:ribonuclease P protein component
MAAPVERLKRRREFLTVAASRRRFVTPSMIVQFLPPNEGVSATRVGFTVSKRVGNAVTRNRARRRLREAAARVMPAHAAAADYVLVGRTETVKRKFADIVLDLETALRRLDAWRDETNSALGRHAS